MDREGPWELGRLHPSTDRCPPGLQRAAPTELEEKEAVHWQSKSPHRRADPGRAGVDWEIHRRAINRGAHAERKSGGGCGCGGGRDGGGGGGGYSNGRRGGYGGRGGGRHNSGERNSYSGGYKSQSGGDGSSYGKCDMVPTGAPTAENQQDSALCWEMGYVVIHQARAIYYPILAAIGIPVNVVAIVILSRGKCGLSRCITRYLVAMAVTALLVLIVDPILKLIRLIYFPHSLLNLTPVCCLIEVLVYAATESCVWYTAAFTFDRFVAICCQKLKAQYCTVRTATVVITAVGVLSCFECIPWYFVYEPQYIINNVQWYCQEKASYFTSPAWASFELFHLLLTPCVPLLLILLLNALTVRYILMANKVRRALRARSNAEHRKDPEMESRRRSIILLFAISGSFILLWMTKVTFHIYHRSVPHSYIDNVSGFTAESAGDMLQVLSTCTNTCIYVVTQTKFREELKSGLRYPLHRFLQLMR
uniref:probable G-protein coupled receptor 139 n=1 Tax=Pristiophorus japonicus TaxID=55135 RepID=UPI00398F1A10